MKDGSQLPAELSEPVRSLHWSAFVETSRAANQLADPWPPRPLYLAQVVAGAVPSHIKTSPSSKMFLRSFWYRGVSSDLVDKDEMHIYTLARCAATTGRMCGTSAAARVLGVAGLSPITFGCLQPVILSVSFFIACARVHGTRLPEGTMAAHASARRSHDIVDGR